METPDKWVVIKIIYEDGEILYKVFASWYGGYLRSPSWKMNSGIKIVEDYETHFNFIGYSGSCYQCMKSTYGTNMFSQNSLNTIIETAIKTGVFIEILPENTDWISIVKF